MNSLKKKGYIGFPTLWILFEVAQVIFMAQNGTHCLAEEHISHNKPPR